MRQELTDSESAAPGSHPPTPPPNWVQHQRLLFIEAQLCWGGRLNRSDLMTRFGISLPQASLDVARYIAVAQQNLCYDKREKTYFATPEFTPVFQIPDATAYLEGLRSHLGDQSTGWTPPLDYVPQPSRRIDGLVLRKILMAIRQAQRVRVLYQSKTRANPTEREISPHAIAFDGSRWHTRAFCHEHSEFRDFVFSRILSVLGHQPTDVDPASDHSWHQSIELIFVPDPGLTDAQRRVVELDYAMESGKLLLKTRKALAFYVLRQLGLDPQSPEPAPKQLALQNREIVETSLESNDQASR
jgi:hypothetical protein